MPQDLRNARDSLRRWVEASDIADPKLATVMNALSLLNSLCSPIEVVTVAGLEIDV